MAESNAKFQQTHFLVSRPSGRDSPTEFPMGSYTASRELWSADLRWPPHRHNGWGTLRHDYLSHFLETMASVERGIGGVRVLEISADRLHVTLGQCWLEQI